MRNAMAAPPQPSPAPLAQRLAQFAADLRWDDVPAPVRERARYLVLDCAGCALAAGRFDFAAPTLAALADLGGAGDSVVVGQPRRLPLRDAVLANGVLAHGLDYDDTHSRAIVHLSVSAFPTALGVAAQQDRSGRELLEAYLVALEAGARIGAAARGGFHGAGFHPTGVVGAFGCALAAGRLLGLAPAQLAGAQGIVLSMAAGSLEFLEHGAWTKRLHPGWAGVSGIVAAALARREFRAPPAAYEGRHGLYALYLRDESMARDLESSLAGLGSEWETMEVAVKPFPACHLLHAFADAAIAMRATGLDMARIARITARVPAGIVPVVCEPAARKLRPVSDYDARFSLPFVVATALLRGRFGLAELEAEALGDRDALALAANVGYEVDATLDYPRYYGGELVVRLDDGTELRHREAVNRGSAGRPLTNAEIEEKYRQNAAFAVGASRAAQIRDAVLQLESAASARAFAETLVERA